MATVYVSMAPAGIKAGGAVIDVFQGNNARSEVITSAATNVFGTLRGRGGEIAQIYCETPVYVASHEANAVTATTGVFVPPSVPVYISVADNDRIAVINA